MTENPTITLNPEQLEGIVNFVKDNPDVLIDTNDTSIYFTLTSEQLQNILNFVKDNPDVIIDTNKAYSYYTRTLGTEKKTYIPSPFTIGD